MVRFSKQTSSELPLWLALSRLPKVGPKRFQKLLNFSADLSHFFDKEAPSPALKEILNVPEPIQFDWEGVEQDLAWAQHSCHTILTLADPQYPRLLKEISNPPPVLFVQGNPKVLNAPLLGMVGSRNPTSLGKEMAFHFAKSLVEKGLGITSGLALGVDSWAHNGALAGNGITIGVLGHGLDMIYPASNKSLAEKILTHGALVSEFPLGVKPDRQNFPRRNRVISGLSLGVLVVEATLKSGSLITANYALDQNREVFALPGSLYNPLAKGCHALIREGAKLVEVAEDILEELNISTSAIDQGASLGKKAGKRGLSRPRGKKRWALLSYIGHESTPIEVVIQRAGLPAPIVSSLLLELELEGLVASCGGGYRLTTD